MTTTAISTTGANGGGGGVTAIGTSSVSPASPSTTVKKDLKRDFVVLKYGGTSVSTAATWRAICERAREVMREGYHVWIVVSAISQVTNKLIACIDDEKEYKWIVERHRQLQADLGLSETDVEPVFALLRELQRLLEGIQLTGEVTPKLRARICAMGEQCSSFMGRAYLRRELASEALVSRVDARKLLVSYDRGPTEHDESKYLEADVVPRVAVEEAYALIKAEHPDETSDSVENGKNLVVITQGFIASTPGGHTCLLGRGGSDTSGALFAALLKAKRCEIWTDVYGLFTCDPRLLPEARLIREMSYREAQELAAMGAKVLHPRCLGPAQWGGVPVEVRNTMDPAGSSRGILTRVCANPDEGAIAGKPRVVAVTKRTGQFLLTVENFEMWGASGFLSRVFQPFAHNGIGVDLIATSEYSVSMTLENVPGGFRGPVLAKLVAELKSIVPRGTVTVEDRIAIVSIVGRRLRTALASLAKALKCTRGYDVRMVTESAEDLNLSFVVADSGAVPGYVDALVAALHNALFKHNQPRQKQGELVEDYDEDEDESLGASWDELRGGTVTPRLVRGAPGIPTNVNATGGGGGGVVTRGSGAPQAQARGTVTSMNGVEELSSSHSAAVTVSHTSTTSTGKRHFGRMSVIVPQWWDSTRGRLHLAHFPTSSTTSRSDDGDEVSPHLVLDEALFFASMERLCGGRAEARLKMTRVDLGDLLGGEARGGSFFPPEAGLLASLARHTGGFLCRTLQEVCDVKTAVPEAVVCFAPMHVATEEEYRRAVGLGCTEILVDEADYAPTLLASLREGKRGNCPLRRASLPVVAVYTRRLVDGYAHYLKEGVAGGEGGGSSAVVRRETRSSRWDALMRAEDGKSGGVEEEGEFLVADGAALAKCVALCAPVVRLSSANNKVYSPSPRLNDLNFLKTHQLQVVNLTRSNASGTATSSTEGVSPSLNDKTFAEIFQMSGETRVGDVLLFYRIPSGEDEGASAHWWREI